MNWLHGSLVLAVVLSAAGSLFVARLYRRKVVRLMSERPVQSGAERPGLAWIDEPVSAATNVGLAGNVRAGWELIGLLTALSTLMAATAAAIQLALMDGGGLLSVNRWLVLTALGTWPTVVVLALVWRWSRGALLLSVIPWTAAAVGLMVWRSIEGSAASSLAFVLLNLLVPLLLIVLLCLGSTTRAIGPWLIFPLCVGMTASVAGVELALHILGSTTASHPLNTAVVALGPASSVAVFAVLPWLAIWWPMYWLGQALAGTYARKQLSELLMLFGVVWFIALGWQAAALIPENGASAVLLFLPLAWVPPVVALTKRLRQRRLGKARPPTMLVLRVFRREADIQRLFDRVIERWRLTGNTVLIAAPDLLERTIDADGLFTFIDGGLDQLFIRRRSDIAVRMGLFDFTPDAEGRYRVNGCYCKDDTWKDAMEVLLRMADVVLMDLRTFQAHNVGAAHELGLLATSPGLRKVVLLHDNVTDLAAARALVSAAPNGRIVWSCIDGRLEGKHSRAVLAQLLE